MLRPEASGRFALSSARFMEDYHLAMTNIAMENPLKMEVLMGKSSINGQFSMAMLNNQRV